MKSAVFTLSNIIYDIKEKLSDNEFKLLMDTCKQLNTKEEEKKVYCFQLVIPTLESDYDTSEGKISKGYTIKNEFVSFKSRITACKLNPNIQITDYCYHCSNLQNPGENQTIESCAFLKNIERLILNPKECYGLESFVKCCVDQYEYCSFLQSKYTCKREDFFMSDYISCSNCDEEEHHYITSTIDIKCKPFLISIKEC